jgi:hypothetical protein
MFGPMLQLRKNRYFRVFIYCFSCLFLFVGCASTTNIKSRPDGADVFVDNVKVGSTPLNYSDTAIAGSTKALKLKKEGYATFETVIRKSEFQIGPCIGGLFVLFPFVWILGYPEAYEFELEKMQMTEKKPQVEKPTSAETDKK